jgi:hypothetical protein
VAVQTDEEVPRGPLILKLTIDSNSSGVLRTVAEYVEVLEDAESTCLTSGRLFVTGSRSVLQRRSIGSEDLILQGNRGPTG